MVVPSNPARSMKLAAEPPMDDEGTSKSSRQQGVFGTFAVSVYGFHCIGEPMDVPIASANATVI